MADWPDAAELEGSLPAGRDGSFVIEVFAGEFSLSLALAVNHLRCLQPWDVLYGEKFDIEQNGYILKDLAARGRLSYVAIGTPCQSQSWGRLPALRSWQYPLGLPDLTEEQRVLTEKGNLLADFSARLAGAVLDSGGVLLHREP